MNAYIPKDVLQHGRRYVVCIHANATTNVFEKWTQELPDLSVCSNGITVDFTPPTSNDVWIGNQQGQIYQVWYLLWISENVLTLYQTTKFCTLPN